LESFGSIVSHYPAILNLLDYASLKLIPPNKIFWLFEKNNLSLTLCVMPAAPVLSTKNGRTQPQYAKNGPKVGKHTN
jgi:hypothetical protein